MAAKATLDRLKDQALEMRELILKLSNKTMVHLGGDMSMADMMTALYMYKMKKEIGNTSEVAAAEDHYLAL